MELLPILIQQYRFLKKYILFNIKNNNKIKIKKALNKNNYLIIQKCHHYINFQVAIKINKYKILINLVFFCSLMIIKN